MNLKNKRFLDLTSGHNLTHFNQAYLFQKSEFFFGNITPGANMCKLFDKNENTTAKFPLEAELVNKDYVIVGSDK